MNKRHISWVALTALLFVNGCGYFKDKEIKVSATDIEPGMSREQVTSVMGKPNASTVCRRGDRLALGPEKEFWDKLDRNDQVETWMYLTRKGRVYAFFINGGQTVAYTGRENPGQGQMEARPD